MSLAGVIRSTLRLGSSTDDCKRAQKMRQSAEWLHRCFTIPLRGSSFSARYHLEQLLRPAGWNNERICAEVVAVADAMLREEPAQPSADLLALLAAVLLEAPED